MRDSLAHTFRSTSICSWVNRENCTSLLCYIEGLLDAACSLWNAFYLCGNQIGNNILWSPNSVWKKSNMILIESNYGFKKLRICLKNCFFYGLIDSAKVGIFKYIIFFILNKNVNNLLLWLWIAFWSLWCRFSFFAFVSLKRWILSRTVNAILRLFVLPFFIFFFFLSARNVKSQHSDTCIVSHLAQNPANMGMSHPTSVAGLRQLQPGKRFLAERRKDCARS